MRYDAALEVMHRIGLDDRCTVMDVGSGWGEFGARMHTGRACPGERVAVNSCAGCIGPSRARYIPVDAGNDGTDLNDWTPPRDVDYIVALEVVEHLTNPSAFLNRCCMAARRAVIVSTPNPAVVDVLGMDRTHVTVVGESRLTALGFAVESRAFYGTVDDSLFGVWEQEPPRRPIV